MYPAWLDVETNPLPKEDVTKTNIKVCFQFFDNDDKCCDRSTTIAIRNCSSFFVYMLGPSRECAVRYCGTD